MNDKTQSLVLWRTEHSLLSVEELARGAGVQAGTVEVFVRYRLIEPSTNAGCDQLFPSSVIERVQQIVHLRQDLGVNFAGVMIILEMTERLERIQRELEHLRQPSGP
jgi:MerR family transcriptional regulator, heat shock protein HspR